MASVEQRLSLLPADDSSDRLSNTTMNAKPQRRCQFANGTRFLVSLLVCLCLAMCLANAATLNFTVICMVKEVELIVGGNGSTVVKTPLPKYSPTEESYLFSAIAIGCLLGTAPISALIAHYGIRKIFATYGLVSGVSMVLMPAAADVGIWAVFAMRLLQGVGSSTSFVVMGSVVAEYAPFRRSGVYLAAISTHMQLSTIISMPSAAIACQSEWGWASVYYLQGGFTVLLFTIFAIFYTDSAAAHPNISTKELQTIRRDKATPLDRCRVPHKAILSDPAVIGCWVSLFGGTLGYQVFVQYGPVYLNKVLSFDIGYTGFTSALPAFLCIFVKLLVGPVSDALPFFGPRGRIVLFASISQFTMAACFIILALLPSSSSAVAQMVFTTAYLFSGLNIVGVIKSCQLISGHFVHFVMAVNAFNSGAVMLLLPLVVSYAAPNHSREEWSKILICVALFVASVTVVFIATARGHPRPWVEQNTITVQTVYIPEVKTAEVR